MPSTCENHENRDVGCLLALLQCVRRLIAGEEFAEDEVARRAHQPIHALEYPTVCPQLRTIIREGLGFSCSCLK